MTYHLLIVDNEREFADALASTLQRFEYQTTVVYDGRAALNLDTKFDLVLLDVKLGGSVMFEGLAVCQKIRARPNPPPVIMMTAFGSEDEIAGLESGASTYITKPFQPNVLHARIKAVLRTVEEVKESMMVKAPPQSSGQLIRIDERLQIDQPKRKVYLDGVEVDLARREFDLLLFLADHPGQVFTRQELLDKVWGMTSGYGENTVIQHITRLRHKLKDDPHNPRYIFTEHGTGYRFCEWRP